MTAVDVDQAAASAGPMVPAPFSVLATERDTVDTWTLELEALDGEPFPFTPGQFTMISAGGHGEVPISICGDADRPETLVHTIRSVGLATAAICAARRGDVLWVRGPYGGGWPDDLLAGQDVVVAVGGIGLPPLRPTIRRLLAHRERYGRLVLLYGGRSPDQLLYPAERESWQQQGMEILTTVDSAGPEWLGHVGVVTRLIGRAKLDGERTIAMTCGPEIMMRFLVSGLGAVGVTSDRVYASMERNMQCGIGHCGHCQFGPTLICRDGPIYPWSEVERWMTIREL